MSKSLEDLRRNNPDYYTLEDAVNIWPELDPAARALVRIYDYQNGDFGSGVVIPNRILTARHVLEDSSGNIDIDNPRHRLQLPGFLPQDENQASRLTGAVFGDNPDFAVIPLPSTLSDHPYVNLYHGEIQEGDEVFNLGFILHPYLGLLGKSMPVVIPGRVLYVSRNVIAVSQQTNIDIHGMSGGPLVKNGQLIGTSMGSHTVDINYNTSLAQMEKLGLLG